MSVCPFCKASASSSNAPCPKCGKLASDHPSIAASTMGKMLGDDFGEDAVPDLVLEKGGGSIASTPKVSDPYAGQGLELDDDLLSDDPGGPLELDVPQGHGAKTPRTSGHAPPPADLSVPMPGTATSRKPPAPVASQKPPPSSGAPVPSSPPRGMPAPESEGSPSLVPLATLSRVASKPSAAQIVAKYPALPTKIWQTPVYTMKVLLRQLELRQDLASLRKRRSPDVALYEAALRAHDAKTFLVGLALAFAGLVLATFLVFLPVILRNLGD